MTIRVGSLVTAHEIINNESYYSYLYYANHTNIPIT